MQQTGDQIQMKPVRGFEGRYSVTNKGEIFSHVSGRFLRLKPHDAGYYAISLTDGNGGVFDKLVHRIVCEAFNGPAPYGKEFVNHIDGNKRNNDACNLEWCSREENMRHAISTGLMAAQPIAVSKANCRRAKPVVGIMSDGTVLRFPSITAARKAGFAKVSDCLLGNRKTSGGATWRFA